VGLYQRSDSRFWWMSYTMNGEQYQESTKTVSKELASKIIKQRESEIVLGLFKVGWAGDRLTFDQLSAEFERSHFAGLAENTVKGHRAYLKHLKAFFGESKLNRITVESVEEYRAQRRAQPAKTNPNRTIKGATVNRELECLKCVLDLAVKRKYIPENPAAAVKHSNELRERPNRRMLPIEEEMRILEAAPPHLRVAIILLSQTGGRTYSEGFSLRWDQVDFDNKLIRLDNNVKTPGSTEPIVCLRGFAGVEQGAISEESVCLPEPTPTRPADFHGQDCLEGHAQTSRRAAFSDLHAAARFLHSTQRVRS